jgi:hypothetical protein
MAARQQALLPWKQELSLTTGFLDTDEKDKDSLFFSTTYTRPFRPFLCRS